MEKGPWQRLKDIAKLAVSLRGTVSNIRKRKCSVENWSCVSSRQKMGYQLNTQKQLLRTTKAIKLRYFSISLWKYAVFFNSLRYLLLTFLRSLTIFLTDDLETTELEALQKKLQQVAINKWSPLVVPKMKISILTR